MMKYWLRHCYTDLHHAHASACKHPARCNIFFFAILHSYNLILWFGGTRSNVTSCWSKLGCHGNKDGGRSECWMTWQKNSHRFAWRRLPVQAYYITCNKWLVNYESNSSLLLGEWSRPAANIMAPYCVCRCSVVDFQLRASDGGPKFRAGTR